jgi:hypothetical protein
MDALELMRTGKVDVLGHLPYASNYTFLAKVEAAGDETLSVYKPRRGERPLWDFPTGTLAAREVAAWVVSEAAGWEIVPPTVLREDAPFGAGSLQLFIDHDPERHYLVLMEDRLEEFPPFAALDVVINNADRKAGHVLEDRAGRLWAVDHGVTFHTEPKLRTVIWQFAGEPITAEVRAALKRLERELSGDTETAASLRSLLSEQEATATLERTTALLVADQFPQPGGHHPLPWPLI